ncbi:hypothetical protein HS088_TW15G01313 [Tripterygium wilfordii]|uniref:Myosin-related n=1 Tax=Tripterygium wilfordii TaxID=458696 RepID=A0A7J7CNZ6_TRIWF|nr:uncharacterized protein LOC119980140 [Tripterygium wilfordii]KAF5735797.1 hypothetical protein HS088_TW15G01313 [Tripterygium wilfordii]
MSTTMAIRRSKWQYPPAPRIIHFPRRPRRKPTKSTPAKPTLQRDRRGKLETLFDQEREFARGVVPIVLVSGRGGGGGGEDCEGRRERVEERKSSSVGVEEEKWRFQAEMLRAECNLLRMEKEIAVKKMERRRVQIERTLRSTVQTLLSGREEICEGKNPSIVLEEEIRHLAGKLQKLQRDSGHKDFEVRNCRNFDKKASLLQRQLKEFGDTSEEICVKEIREMAEASLSIKAQCSVDESFSNTNTNCNSPQMEILRKKMEGLSKGILLERMEEEYGSMLHTANSSTANSASNSKRIELPDKSFTSIRHPYKEIVPKEEKVCSGRCKAIVRRIVEQVRAETEQWSQLQEMLGQVRDEMEELQVSRDFWEDRALDSDYEIQTLHSAVQKWRERALSSEAKTNELQAQLSILHEEAEKLRTKQNTKPAMSKISPPCPRDAQNEMEKRVLVCQLKENHHPNSNGDRQKQKGVFNDGRRKAHTSTSRLAAPKRSPFRDIGNSSPLVRQNSRAVFPLHCPLPSTTDNSY